VYASTSLSIAVEMIFFASSVFISVLLDNVKYYQLPYIRALVLAPTGTILPAELLNNARCMGVATGKKSTSRQVW
ncbi:MAG: hypothetical protein MUO95_08810, partial [Methanoregula sp.]|nr:hypothetical protein [Methanoregula sp.]